MKLSALYRSARSKKLEMFDPGDMVRCKHEEWTSTFWFDHELGNGGWFWATGGARSYHNVGPDHTMIVLNTLTLGDPKQGSTYVLVLIDGTAKYVSANNVVKVTV